METDLSTLKISESELENLSGIPIDEVIITNLYWHFSTHKPIKFKSIFFHQILIFALTLIISFPLGLMITSKTNYASDDPQLFFLLLKIAIALSLIITISWNIYMWLKTKPLIFLADLIEEINKYNQLIKTIEIVDQIANSDNVKMNLNKRKETLEVLTITGENLINAVKNERIIRENKGLIEKQYQLLVNMENNFSTLMNYEINEQASEYTRLLNQALEINTSVQKEMLKLQNRIEH
jgi:hypothetical protein